MKKFILKLSTLVLLAFLTGSFFFTKPYEKVEAADEYASKVEELRAVWISTVYNIDIASQKGTGQAAILDYQAKFLDILAQVKYYGMNAIFFQVRPTNDAFYESDYNPWSDCLVGAGVNPGWDPLEWILEVCHNEGVEVHAWLNPYRASVSAPVSTSSPQSEIDSYKKSHARTILNNLGDKEIDNPALDIDNPEFLENVLISGDKQLILNPVRDVTINHIKNTIDELITNYEIDGIHFDDYFYPSAGLENKVINADYAAYQQAGGSLSIDDWKRDWVNKMVKTVSDLMAEHNSTSEHYVSFGISPAPLWAPGPQSCNNPDRYMEGGADFSCGGYSTYFDLFADTKLWVESEWIDYIVPQAYTSLDETYKTHVDWWSKIVAPTDVKLYIGTSLYKASDWKDYHEIKNQIEYVNSQPTSRENVHGYSIYSYRNLVSSDSYIKGNNTDIYNLWRRGALAPVYQKVDAPSVEQPETKGIKFSNRTRLIFTEVANANGYAVYRFNEGEEINFDGKTPTKVFNQRTGDSELYIETALLEGYVYVLCTFDLNNEMFAEYQTFKPEEAIENQKPVITMYEWDETITTYPKEEEIIVKVKVEDDGELTELPKVSFSANGTSFQTARAMTHLGDGIYTYSFKPYANIANTACFKITATDGDYTVELVTSSFSIESQIKKEYTVTFDTLGAPEVEAQTVVEGGCAVKPADVVLEGYVFEGWYLGDELFDFNTPITENITLTARLEPALAKPQPQPGTSTCAMGVNYLLVASGAILAVLFLRKARK